MAGQEAEEGGESRLCVFWRHPSHQSHCCFHYNRGQLNSTQLNKINRFDLKLKLSLSGQGRSRIRTKNKNRLVCIIWLSFEILIGYLFVNYQMVPGYSSFTIYSFSIYIFFFSENKIFLLQIWLYNSILD